MKDWNEFSVTNYQYQIDKTITLIQLNVFYLLNC